MRKLLRKKKRESASQERGYVQEIDFLSLIKLNDQKINKYLNLISCFIFFLHFINLPNIKNAIILQK